MLIAYWTDPEWREFDVFTTMWLRFQFFYAVSSKIRESIIPWRGVSRPLNMKALRSFETSETITQWRAVFRPLNIKAYALSK
jgi:hypothetical protein